MLRQPQTSTGRMERGISIAPARTAAAPACSAHHAPVWHMPVTEFPGTNWVKFSCLGNVQFLKLRVFLSKTHKINDLTFGACFAH